jgi:hypothetical protein
MLFGAPQKKAPGRLAQGLIFGCGGSQPPSDAEIDPRPVPLTLRDGGQYGHSEMTLRCENNISGQQRPFRRGA